MTLTSNILITPAASPLPLTLTHGNSFSPHQTPLSHFKRAYSLSLFSFPLPITSTSLSSCQPPPSLCQWQQPQWLCVCFFIRHLLPFHQAIPHAWEKLHVKICWIATSLKSLLETYHLAFHDASSKLQEYTLLFLLNSVSHVATLSLKPSLPCFVYLLHFFQHLERACSKKETAFFTSCLVESMNPEALTHESVSKLHPIIYNVT